MPYIIIALVVGTIVAVKFIKDKKKPKTNEEMYKAFLKEINNAFNNILIDITYIPEIGERTLVRLNNIDDLVDISETIRKPIYYIENKSTCDFILLNNDEYCLYTLKAEETKTSEFDKYYKEYEENNKKGDANLLEDLSKTTIIKIPNGSSFKVSPLKERDIREQKEKEFFQAMRKEFLPKLKDDKENSQ